MTAADGPASKLTRREAFVLAPSMILVPSGGHADPGLATTWDLTALYRTPEAWMTERAAVLDALPGLLAFKGRLGAGAATRPRARSAPDR